MEKEELKILEEGESTYRNGGSSMCGGIISKTTFDSNPRAYMMAYYMEDDKFAEYKKLKTNGKDKEATKLFETHAISAI